MNQKYALTLAVGITAFVLVVGGGIAAKFGHPASAPATAVAPMPTATDIQAFYAQREAEYQAQIDAANQALAEAYAQLEAASTATQQPQSTAMQDPQSTATQDPQSTPTPDFYLTPQGAMSAAILTVPGATILSVPELVNYQGIVAYEVRLDSGIVYVDASNGAVLYNGAAQAQVPAPARRHGDDNENGHDD
jgi:uncharacterized membrane protein YkoI